MAKPKIKELVLDVLKSHTPSLPVFATLLAELPGVDNVVVSLIEKDQRTESLVVTLQGCDLIYNNLNEYMGKHGAVIHSVDKVSVESEE